jgi:amino acid transporter
MVGTWSLFDVYIYNIFLLNFLIIRKKSGREEKPISLGEYFCYHLCFLFSKNMKPILRDAEKLLHIIYF